MTSFIQRSTIEAFVTEVDAAFARPGRLYLIGETSLVLEGLRRWTDRLLFCAAVAAEDRPAFNRAVRTVQAALDVPVEEECPGDLIPLPDGYEARARPVEAAIDAHRGLLHVAHFDPYSVAFRFIARGDEPDYHLVLTYLEHGWITVDRMNMLLDDLLPRFTFQSIQQDPAEFRRRYHGLLQMWRTLHSGTMHRPL